MWFRENHRRRATFPSSSTASCCTWIPWSSMRWNVGKSMSMPSSRNSFYDVRRCCGVVGPDTGRDCRLRSSVAGAFYSLLCRGPCALAARPSSQCRACYHEAEQRCLLSAAEARRQRIIAAQRSGLATGRSSRPTKPGHTGTPAEPRVRLAAHTALQENGSRRSGCDTRVSCLPPSVAALRSSRSKATVTAKRPDRARFARPAAARSLARRAGTGDPPGPSPPNAL